MKCQMAKAERAVWVSALVVLLMMSPALLSCAGESNIQESAGMISLWTDDGLELSLEKSDGKAKELRVGGESFPLDAPLVRFEEVIEDPDAPDLLAENALRYIRQSGHSGPAARGRKGEPPV